MRLPSVVVLCCISVSLMAACSDNRPSTCVGVSRPGKSLDAVDQYFRGTDFDKYVGLTLGELSRNFVVKYEKRSGIAKPATNLIGITYTFPRDYSIEVHFSETKYTKYDSQANKWNFGRLGKERIASIRVKHYGTADYYCKEFGMQGAQDL